MSCNPNFYAGFGVAVLCVTLYLILNYLCRKPAITVEPFCCPHCGCQETVLEAVEIGSSSL